MKRSEILWLAFEKFAIFFSFVVTFILVMILLVAVFVLWTQLDTVQGLKDGLVCDTITGVNKLVDDFENAVITRTISISKTIPVQFVLPVNQNTVTELTDDVQLRRPATYVLPAGGGRINGTVYLVLPTGLDLPVRLNMPVPVDQQLAVQMDVPVSIPLKETGLGDVIGQLKDLLEPLQLRKLEKTLRCPPR